MPQSVRRVARGASLEGVELTEEKLQKMIDALHATADRMDRRTALRLPVEGYVDIELVTPGSEPVARRVGVYDLSRTGVAVIDDEPMDAGRQFNMLIPREDRRPIEVLCLARHSRQQGDGYVIGAQFGVSWLAAVGAAVIPPRP
ncbi:MAG: PilZ domain-containing protein [Tepidisphaeraceae bacterium]